MIAYAAIDLRGGRVVQLVGGRVEAERVSWADPAGVAQRWQASGFAALHVVDLDAALGGGHNLEHITDIIRAVNIPVQVGGGVRDEATAEKLFDLGADRVIVGTRALEDPEWRRRLAEKHSARVVVAADVRGGSVVTRGWQMATSHDVCDFIQTLDAEPLAAVLVTDVTREGQMTGVDRELFERVVRAAPHPLIAAGGIRDAADLHTLAAVGAAGAVLGMALYDGAIDVAAIAPEFVA